MGIDVHRLCVEDTDGSIHKIASLSANSTGIYVSSPYHKARKGYFQLIRPSGEVGIHWAKPHLNYFANSRAKLSLHPPNAQNPDSFAVHFSGSGIISGFDEDGAPKGLALKGPPMDEITTGPTFGLLAWGLMDFDKPRSKDKNLMIFQQKDLIYSMYEGSIPAYHLEFFLFPNSKRKSKKKIGSFYHKYIFENVERGFYFKVIELPKELNSFLGIICVRNKVNFSDSGYQLNSPRLQGWMISGMYPFDKEVESSVSLDYKA